MRRQRTRLNAASGSWCSRPGSRRRLRARAPPRSRKQPSKPARRAAATASPAAPAAAVARVPVTFCHRHAAMPDGGETCSTVMEWSYSLRIPPITEVMEGMLGMLKHR